MTSPPSLHRQPLHSLWQARPAPRLKPLTKNLGCCPSRTPAYSTYLATPFSFRPLRRESPRVRCLTASTRTRQRSINSLLTVRKCGQPCSTSPFTEQLADGPTGNCCQTMFAGLRLNFAMKLRMRLNSHQHLASSLKKRPGPSTYPPLPALACRPNRLRCNRRRGRPHSLPPPPSLNQPRCPSPLRHRQSPTVPPTSATAGQKPEPPPSSICAHPSHSPFCPRTPSLYLKPCPPSRHSPPTRHPSNSR